MYNCKIEVINFNIDSINLIKCVFTKNVIVIKYSILSIVKMQSSLHNLQSFKHINSHYAAMKLYQLIIRSFNCTHLDLS